MGLNACVDAPRHDYPSGAPLAASEGLCQNLTGTFENAGSQLKTRYTSSDVRNPILLTSFLLSPGTVPSGAQVTALRIFGPYQGQLQIEALSAGGTVARASMPGGTDDTGFAHSKPFSRFLCYDNQIIIYDEPISTTEVPLRIYRAKDGSLVVAQEHVDAGAVIVSVAPRKWFQFQQVPAKTQPAMQ